MAQTRAAPAGSASGARSAAAGIAAALCLLGCTANGPTQPRGGEAVPPPAPETTSDRGDRFVLLTPIGQMAPEDAPRATPPPAKAAKPSVPAPTPGGAQSPPQGAAWPSSTAPPPPPPPPVERPPAK